MANCPEIDPLITPYVDGEAEGADRAVVASHLEACPPCRRQIRAEATARAVVRDQAGALGEAAPDRLRDRCRRAAAGEAARAAPAPRRRSWVLAVAATVVLTIGGVVGYGMLVRPADLMAAQLTLDHLKCFALSDGSEPVSPAAVEADLKQRYGWDVRLPDASEVPGLTLVGGRRCINLDGAVAHILYRQGRVPVSVFVLPSGVHLQGEVEVLGHQAVMFARGGRTYVVLSREPMAQVEQVAQSFGQVAR